VVIEIRVSVPFFIFGFIAIRRGDMIRHRAWMTRAYAIGLGAGTQALTGMVAWVVGLAIGTAVEPPATNPNADLDTTTSFRSVNYMVNHICEPISPKSVHILPLTSRTARWDQRTAYP